MSSFQAESPQSSPEESRGKSTTTARVPIGFSVVFGLLGLGFMSIGITFVVLQQYRLTTYQPISTHIASSQVAVHTGRHRTAYPKISYAYVVDGETYQSDRVFPAGNFGDAETSARQIVNRYPAGAVATAWYSPTDPTSAFLIHHSSWMPYFICLIPAIFVITSLNLIATNLRAGRQLAQPVPDGNGWFRIAEEGTLRGRFRMTAGMVIFWLVVGGFLAGDYFLVNGKEIDMFFMILVACTVFFGLIGLFRLWRQWQLCHDFLDAEIHLSAPQIRPGDAAKFRLHQEILRPLEIEELSFGVICICDDRVQNGRKVQYTSYESFSQWHKLPVNRNYTAGSHLDAQDHLSLPPEANATTPPRTGGYPFYRWHIALRITAAGQPKLDVRFPINVEPRG